jgi:ribosomal protein S18 acetylase RimI-like enzyme
MKIIVATPDDWERVRAVRLAALRASPDAFSSTYDRESIQPPDWWIERLGSGPATTFIGAGADPQCIGVLAPYGDFPDCGLYAIWVAPESRGTGLSDALLHAALAHARARGFARVLLDVGVENTQAIRLYERHGFASTGVTSCLPAPRSHIREMQMVVNLRTGESGAAG